MLSWEYPPAIEGGLAAHVKGLSEALVSLGHQVHVVTPAPENKEEILEGVRVHRVKFGSFAEAEFPLNVVQDNLGLTNKVAQIIQEEKIHLLHAHDWLVSYSAQSLKHMFQLPLITTIHATEKGRNRGLHNSLQWYIHQTEWGLSFESWQTICCSKFMQHELMEQFDLPENKVSVIPNGIDFKQIATPPPEAKRKYARDEERIIFSIGRIVYEKGFQTIIDSAPLILQEFPNTKFVIAGQGYYLDTLKEKVSFLGLEEKFFFPGFITQQEKEELYKLASLVVFPSFYEPFGIVALEAMLAETPVLVSDVGGLSEVIEHHIDGLKFHPNDPYSLATNAKFLLDNTYFADGVVAKATDKIKKLYTWNKVAKLTEDVYLDVYKDFLASPWGKNKRILVWSGFKSRELVEGDLNSEASNVVECKGDC